MSLADSAAVAVNPPLLTVTGPLRAALVAVRSSEGALGFVVVCKTTFLLEPGRAPLAEDQEEPVEKDHHWNDDAERSLYVASDLVPFKGAVDVTVVGQAFAPRGTPVARLVARVAVASLDKRLLVVGDTALARDLSPTPFARMPLLYERAARGVDNPIGARGLPNLLRVPTDKGTGPTCFGPVPPTWPSRRAYLPNGAPHDVRQLLTAPLPYGLDPRFFNAAPVDQQIPSIGVGEKLVLENLHPDHPRFETRLPEVEPVVFAEFGAAPAAYIRLTCDTLWLDGARRIGTLTWRSALPPGCTRVVVGVEHEDESRRFDRRARRSETVELSSARVSSDEPFERLLVRRETLELEASDLVELRDHDASAIAAPITSALPAFESRPAHRPPVQSVPFVVPNYTPPPAPVPSAPSTPPARPASAPPAAALSPSPAPTPAMATSAPPAASPSSAAAASNAAADPTPLASTPAENAGLETRDAIELLWCDVEAGARVRASKPWGAFLRERQKADEEPGKRVVERSKEDRTRRDFARLLGAGTAQNHALAGDPERWPIGSVGDDDVLKAPVLLLAGTLELALDPIEALAATCASAGPAAARDPALKGLVEAARELLRAPEGLGTMAEAYLVELRAALRRDKRTPPVDLEALVERALIEKRSYAKRRLLGAEMLRGRVRLGAGDDIGDGIPAYLSNEATDRLPMFRRHAVRLVVEVVQRQDEREPHPRALHVLALGRGVRASARPT